jgi:hypothetical protein
MSGGPSDADGLASTARWVSGAQPAKSVQRQIMSESEQTYGEGRARNLEALLRALAERIRELDSEGKLLAQAGELMRLIGDVRSELFHYEVRATYDTPEVAENRRIVSDARTQQEATWEKTDWSRDEEDESEW